MAPTPHRIAQTSTELKKLAKKNGPRLNERQQKQLEREAELEQRAARARKAEESRKAAKKKREEKEAKEARARQQIGVGLATQLAGYSHTQAQLKNGMEAFLGLSRKKEEEKRKKNLELTKKLEKIAEQMEKEPWDDDDEEDTVVDLPETTASSGQQWADDDLDDDTLLEAHDMVMSDPVEELQPVVQPSESVAPIAPAVVQPLVPVHPIALAPLTAPSPPPQPIPAQDDREFARTHGPINKAIEAALDKLPEPLIELLSQDLSLKTPDWDPSLGLLHKLNPLPSIPGRMPPPSLARKPTPLAVKAKPTINQNPGFKLPGVPASKSSSFTAVESTIVLKKTSSIPLPPTDCWDDFFESSTQVSRELASEATPTAKEPPKPSTIALPSVVDDIPPISTQDFDFSLDDLDEEPRKEEEKCKVAPVTHVAPSKVSVPLQANSGNPRPVQRPMSLPLPSEPAKPSVNPISKPVKPLTGPARTDAAVTQKESTPRASANSSRPLTTSRPPKKIAGKCLNPGPFAYGNLQEQLAKLRASQLPKSMTGPYAKRKATTTPSGNSASPPAKKQCAPTPTPPSKLSAAAPRTSQCFEDFAMSTQEVVSFFDDDDDNMSFRSSPPIAV
ncbi:hypothetical protein AG0111_0g9597 [Alternaria gaisen]|uniref:Uncharacterized protein n=1 Tax=Alternaria gaisen TaxID=167740 RepID=A0ACB6FCZ2_9PLEO|nr:hypothetical protein AG0111_0g9597 [Alternaria gaisen]